MYCIVCGRPCEKVDLYRGPYCSEAHYQKMLEDERRLNAKVLAEPGGVLPELFDLDALEHLALRIAVHILEGIPPEERDPGDFPACHIALVVKEKLIQYIPPAYLSRLPRDDSARLFVSQTYQARMRIPREVVRTALEKAHFLRLVE